MPVLAHLQCVKCEWEVFAEPNGKKVPRWDGSCPKCKTNAWSWLGGTTDPFAGLAKAADDLDAILVPYPKQVKENQR